MSLQVPSNDQHPRRRSQSHGPPAFDYYPQERSRPQEATTDDDHSHDRRGYQGVTTSDYRQQDHSYIIPRSLRPPNSNQTAPRIRLPASSEESAEPTDYQKYLLDSALNYLKSHAHRELRNYDAECQERILQARGRLSDGKWNGCAYSFRRIQQEFEDWKPHSTRSAKVARIASDVLISIGWTTDIKDYDWWAYEVDESQRTRNARLDPLSWLGAAAPVAAAATMGATAIYYLDRHLNSSSSYAGSSRSRDRSSEGRERRR